MNTEPIVKAILADARDNRFEQRTARVILNAATYHVEFDGFHEPLSITFKSYDHVTFYRNSGAVIRLDPSYRPEPTPTPRNYW